MQTYEMGQAWVLSGMVVDLSAELIKAMNSLPRKMATHTNQIEL